MVRSLVVAYFLRARLILSNIEPPLGADLDAKPLLEVASFEGALEIRLSSSQSLLLSFRFKLAPKF